MRIYVLLLALAAAGCHWDLNETGTDPEPAQLYFPTGLVVDPSHRFAYVSNGNADLRYGGGTIQMIDLLRLECAIYTLRNAYGLPAAGPPAECAGHGPGSGDDWTFDTDPLQHKWCQIDPIDQTIVDCDETPFIVGNQTVKVGNFAGDLVMELDPNNPLHRNLFVSVRGDPSVTYLNVNLPPIVLPTADFPVAPEVYTGDMGPMRPTQMPRAVSCFDDSSSLLGRDGIKTQVQNVGGFPLVTGVVSKPPGCDTHYLIQQDRCINYPYCLAGDDGQGDDPLPTEPFGMRIDVAKDRSYQRLLVTSLATGQVSMIDLSGVFPVLKTSSQPFFAPSSTGQHGAFALAPRDPGDPASIWYLSSNLSSSLDTFRVASADLIVPQSTVSLQSTFILGTDMRAMEFDPTGDRLFLTGNAPPALITVDTHLQPSPGGDMPANLVSSVIDVCQAPSHMKIRRLLAAGAPGQSTLIKTAVMVVCFLSSQMMIVNPDTNSVENIIFSGFGGPNQIDLNFGNWDDAPPPATPWDVSLPPRGYVTNYLDSTISVVDFDPGSPTVNHVIARLGNPPDGPQSTGPGPNRKSPPQ